MCIYLLFMCFQELNLWKTVDTSATVIKSLTNILKKYMSRDLAMTFTAVKKMEGKQILKTTIFSSCIQSKSFL